MREGFPAFDEAAHDEWVDRGFCDSVEGGTWCSGTDQHQGDHHAPFVMAGGTTVTRTWPNKAGSSNE
jgi:hypothetical protein